jgi:hypothetical protein
MGVRCEEAPSPARPAGGGVNGVPERVGVMNEGGALGGAVSQRAARPAGPGLLPHGGPPRGLDFGRFWALQVNIDRKPQDFPLKFPSRLITSAMRPQNKKLLFR